MTKEKELRDTDGAAGSFVHPGDAMDGPDSVDSPLDPLAIEPRDAEIVRRLLVMCLPWRMPYKGGRKWQACYTRMVVIAYVVAPEMFDNVKQVEIARFLNLSVQSFKNLQTEVVRQLAARDEANQKRVAQRSSS